MPLPTKSASQITNEQVAAMQAAANQPLDFSVGAILRAIVESNTGNTMWLQALVQKLLAVTRLQSSTGNDVDTFVGQFGLTRLPATPASGAVTFSRFTDTLQAVIPVGALVSCVANGVTYSVTVDSANSYYHPNLNAYVIPAATASIDVPVIAQTAGAVGNVLANQITTIASVIVNVDSVTNAQPFTNGQNQESDDALKTRFVLYLDSLSKATKQALQAAVLGVEGVARYKLVENKTVSNADQPGFFYAVVDDGTGSASGTLLENVQTALDATRAFTVAFSVYAPTDVPMSISTHVFTNGSKPDETVEANVVAALENYVTAQSFDGFFAYSRIPEIIYDADASITNVNNYTLNGGTADIQLTGREIMTVGTITVVMNA